MNIFYSPQYTGYTFADLKGNGGLLFDAVIVDTAGLMNLICLHGGLHYQVHDSTERLVAYYKAMRDYTESHPGNILEKSFQTDGLNTAKVCLSWRDALVLAGWTEGTTAPSERMEVLQGIEEFFDCPGNVDQIAMITDAVQKGCMLPDDMNIITPCDYKLFHPAIVKLLEALMARGAEIRTLETACHNEDNNLSSVVHILKGEEKTVVNLKKNDPSLKVLSFEERDDALRWLSLQPDDAYDVWIDSDAKSLDNYLSLEGKPTTGSTVYQCMPQISQLFVIGLSLFSNPLNVNMLLEWLYAPLSPVSRTLARVLSAKIVAKGGYFNDECKEVIKKYLDGEYDWFEEGTSEEKKKKSIEKDRKRKENMLKNFLYFFEEDKGYTESDSNEVNFNKLHDFTEALNKWAKQQMMITDNEERIAQLGKISTETAAVLLLLEDYKGETIPFSTIENWMGSLYKYADYKQYDAQRGCRNTVSSPGCIIGQPTKTIWCDFIGGDAEKLTYSFLTYKEKESFKKGLKLWDEAKEQKYRRSMLLMPFMMTKDELTLVTYNRDGGNEAEKQPLMIQLEQQIKDLDKSFIQPSLDKSLFEDPTPVDNKNRNENNDEFIHLPRPELIQDRFPKSESYSSLSNMFQSPLDYVFQAMADIYPSGLSAMSPIWTTKGNVAHAVIQTIFWNKDNEMSGYPDAVEKNLKDNYDSIFAEKVNAYGAIMLLPENIIDTQTFKEQLRQCASRLLDIVKVNHLHVTGIEHFEKSQLGFSPDIYLLGYIDMLLANDSGVPFIFDFKWSGNQKWFGGLLRENKSLQLSLYRALVNERSSKHVGGVGYFLMPEGRLITTGGITGDTVTTIELDEERKDCNLIEEMRNSYSYRRSQLEQGLIEIGDGEDPAALHYGQDESKLDLVPLDTDDEGNKAGNKFSNYDCFKRK
jgi:hypothetical protein